MSVVLFMLPRFSFFRFLSVADLGEAYTNNQKIIHLPTKIAIEDPAIQKGEQICERAV